MEKKEKEEEIGREVKENNEKIVKCLLDLKTQREDLMFLIQKQLDERKKMEMEMERLTYKMCLINKSMSQRLKAKHDYDVTIEEIEQQYKKLKENSGELRSLVSKDCQDLDSMINKKTSTEDMESVKEETPSVKEETPCAKEKTSIVKENTPNVIEKLPSVKEADVEKITISPTNAVKPADEECVCLPNKDGRCIREKMVSKMVQAAPVEPELPIKLEKESKMESRKDSNSSKQSQEKSAQTAVMGEPDTTTTDDDEEEFNTQNSKVSQESTQQKEMNLRKSN